MKTRRYWVPKLNRIPAPAHIKTIIIATIMPPLQGWRSLSWYPAAPTKYSNAQRDHPRGVGRIEESMVNYNLWRLGGNFYQITIYKTYGFQDLILSNTRSTTLRSRLQTVQGYMQILKNLPTPGCKQNSDYSGAKADRKWCELQPFLGAWSQRHFAKKGWSYHFRPLFLGHFFWRRKRSDNNQIKKAPKTHPHPLPGGEPEEQNHLISSYISIVFQMA